MRRYLEQLQEHKKKEKMSQNEVLGMLNRNLKDEVLIFIVGTIIQQQKLLSHCFDGRLQSEIIFMLRLCTYNLDDHVFDENDLDDKKQGYIEKFTNGQNLKFNQVSKNGQGMFFILQGNLLCL